MADFIHPDFHERIGFIKTLLLDGIFCRFNSICYRFNHLSPIISLEIIQFKNGKIKKAASDKANKTESVHPLKLLNNIKLFWALLVLFSIALLVAFISFFYLWTTRSKCC
jgi:hypothetical protein